MKCSNCGAELVNGTKFCGECGTKVEPKAHVVDWNGKFVVEDASILLREIQINGVRAALKAAKKKANDNRVLLPEDSGFGVRFEAFKNLYCKRIGMDADKTPFFMEGMAVGFVVNGGEGTGERGTLFTKMGILIVDKTFPFSDGEGDPIGAIIPWKMFYIFGERIGGDLGEKAYRLMKPSVMLKSDMIDEVIKAGLRDDMKRENGDKGLLFRFGDTGLTSDAADDLMTEIKEAIELDVAEEEEEEEEIEEEEGEE